MLFSILINFCLVSAGDSPEKCLVMPPSLVELAERNGFEQICDFYTLLPGVLEPPFVFGYIKGETTEYSAAFWCRKNDIKDTSKEKYYLVFATRGFWGKYSIEDTVSWSYPAGLSLTKDSLLTLDNFHFISDLNVHGPIDVKLEDYGIKSYYEGHAKVFYRHEGKTLVNFQLDP